MTSFKCTEQGQMEDMQYRGGVPRAALRASVVQYTDKHP